MAKFAKKAKKVWIWALYVGTSGLKALLANAEGPPRRPRPGIRMDTPHPGWAEQEPESWWRALKKAAAQLRKEMPGLAESLAGIGLTGQMHSSVFLDGKFKVLRPAILWCDSGGPPGNADSAHGEAPASIQPGGDDFQPGSSPASLCPSRSWLKNNEPENYARLKHLLCVPRTTSGFGSSGELGHRGLGRERHAHV